MIRRIHAITGVTAFLTIFTNWTSTIVSELFGATHTIVAVKQAIPWGFFLLIPALAAAGASGFRMGGKSLRPLILAKKRRMLFIAGNGLLILVPCAFFLSAFASSAHFGARFYGVQLLELCAGAMNLTLISLQIRDGVRLSRRPASHPALA